MAYYETLHVLTQQVGRYTVPDIEQAVPFEVETYVTFLIMMLEKRKIQAQQE